MPNVGKTYISVIVTGLGKAKATFLGMEKQGKKSAKNIANAFTSGAGSGGIFAGMARQIGGLGAAYLGLKGIMASFSAYKTFDKGMRNVNTIIRVSEERFQSLGGELKHLQRQMGVSSADITKGMYQAASAGVAVGDSIEFLGVAAKAAKAGLSSVTTSVDGLTTILNAFKIKASETESVANDMFTAVRLGKTTFEELASNISNFAPLASALGRSFKENAAALATMTVQGTSTAEAATQLNAVYTAILRGQERAKNKSKELAEAFSIQALKAKGLHKFLIDLRDVLGDDEAQMQLLLGRSEAVKALLQLTGKNAQKAGEHLKKFSGNVGELKAAFAQMEKSSNAKIGKMVAALETLATTFLQKVSPAINTAADALSWFMRAMSGDRTADAAIRERVRIAKAMAGDFKAVQKELAAQIKVTPMQADDPDNNYKKQERAINAMANAYSIMIKQSKEEIKQFEKRNDVLINTIKRSAGFNIASEKTSERIDNERAKLTRNLESWERKHKLISDYNKNLEKYGKLQANVNQTEDDGNILAKAKIVSTESLDDRLTQLLTTLSQIDKSNLKSAQALIKEISLIEKQIDAIKVRNSLIKQGKFGDLSIPEMEAKKMQLPEQDLLPVLGQKLTMLNSERDLEKQITELKERRSELGITTHAEEREALTDIINAKQELLDKDRESLEAKKVNLSFTQQLGQASEAGLSSATSMLISEINLFGKANNLATKFLNTLVEIALQQLAINAITKAFSPTGFLGEAFNLKGAAVSSSGGGNDFTGLQDRLGGIESSIGGLITNVAMSQEPIVYFVKPEGIEITKAVTQKNLNLAENYGTNLSEQ